MSPNRDFEIGNEMRYFALFIFLATFIFAKEKIYVLEKKIEIPHTYYFTPLKVHDGKAAFGYIGKIKPTPKEIEAQKRRIRHIIEENIKREYGSMQKWESENEKIGKQSARQIQKRAPAWVRYLLPPSLVQEAIPLLFKGALFFAMHTETSSELYGNLGDTGVVIIDDSVHKIKIGIDEPVVSLDFSPDGRYLAAMSDLSYEDKKGRYHTVAHITLIDSKNYKILHQWVFANAVDELKFTPDGKLSFLLHNPSDWGEKAIRFIDIQRRRLLERSLQFRCGNSTEWAGSIKITHACYLFSPKHSLLLTREGGKIGFYDAKTLQLHFKLPGTFFVHFAHSKPWLVERSGRVIDYAKGEVVRRFFDPMHVGFVDGAFGPKDERVIFSNHFRHFFIFDIALGDKIAQTKDMMRDGGKLFSLTKDGRWIVTEHISSHKVIYAKFLKRTKTDLKIIDAHTLKTTQLIQLPPHQTLLDFALMGERVVFSDFDTIYIYAKER